MLTAFFWRHPGFHHGEAGVHEDHQDGCHKQPEVVGQKRCVQIGEFSSVSRQVEEAQAHEGHRHASKPGERAVRAEAADAFQEKHRTIQEADFLKPRLAPPGRRMQSSCHE